MSDIHIILERYELAPNTAYLLELIPLIEMIWADGANQQPEIHILQNFTVKHLANLTKDADGMEVVSVADANAFIEHFMKERPSKALISDLKGCSRGLMYC